MKHVLIKYIVTGASRLTDETVGGKGQPTPQKKKEKKSKKHTKCTGRISVRERGGTYDAILM